MHPLRKFWEDCRPQFAHLRTNENEKFTPLYDRMILDHFGFSLRGKTVIDYGCGGGILGLHLFDKHKIKEYIGIDISERSRRTAAHNLKLYNAEFYPQDVDFSTLKADVFFSFSTLQHFPTERYLFKFLQRVNASQIPNVCLHIRAAEKNKFNNAYDTKGDVARACHTNEKYVSKILSKYKLIHATAIERPLDAQGLIYEAKK